MRNSCLVYLLSVLMALATMSPAYAVSGLLESYGTPLTDEELAEADGEWSLIVSGAITGAVSAAFSYATGAEDHSLSGLATAVAEGAAWGAVGGAFATVQAVATGASLVATAADTAISCFVGANRVPSKGRSLRSSVIGMISR